MSEEEKKQEEAELAARDTEIQRLAAGQRTLIGGYLFSEGDSVASETEMLPKHLLFTLDAYIQAHGTTDSGKTPDTHPDIFDKVVDYRVDLSKLLDVKKKLSKTPSPWEMECEIIPGLLYLTEKWKEKSGVELVMSDLPNIALLEIVMCREILKLKPELIAAISTVVATGMRDSYGGYPETRAFNRPDLVSRRER